MRYVGIKGKAWEAVKEYVRARESDCYTCPEKGLVGSNAQAGHYFDAATTGNGNELFWKPELIHLQCDRCNGRLKGNKIVYRARLVRDYGEQFVQDCERRRRAVAPVRNWQRVIDEYTELYEAIRRR